MSTLNVTNVQAPAEASSTSLKALPKSWVQWSQAATTIVDSLNVSSMDDDGTGDFGYNMTNAMANNDFCIQMTAGAGNGSSASAIATIAGSLIAVSSFDGLVDTDAGVNVDVAHVCVCTLGLLA